MGSWGNWNETTNAKIDSTTNKWDSVIGGANADWKNSVSTEVNNLSSKATEGLNAFSNDLSKDIMQGFADIGIKGGMKKIEVEKIYDEMQVRDKLVVNCPNFMKQFGVSKIDFGKMFLSEEGEALIATGQAVANDILDTVGGIHQYITPEIVIAVQELLTFVIQDLTQTTLNLAQSLFLSYASVDYPVSLAKTLAEKTLKYTKLNIKSPDKLLEELNTTAEDGSKKINDDEMKRMKDVINGKTSGALSELTKKTQKVLSDISKYSDPIAQYAKFGPDYAIRQVLQIYRKYLNMGIKIVYDAKADLDSKINTYVDFAAQKSGQWSASLTNELQKKTLQKAINNTNTKKQKTQLKATALVNKAVMNLLAQLGG